MRVVIVNPPARARVYGALSPLAAIEPPVWAGIMGAYLTRKGYPSEVLDCEAEGLTIEESAARLAGADLAVFMVYGQQPSASTQCLPAAEAVAKLSGVRTICVGTHPSALPERTLREGPWTYVCQGEGPLTVLGLLHALDGMGRTLDVPGLWYWDGDVPRGNPPAPVMDCEELNDHGLYYFDFDKYRAHNWHCFGFKNRERYASLATSLGCPFRCVHGDTPVNTIDGPIPIKDLVGKNPKVYSYKNGRVVLSGAINVRQYGSGEKLVRVKFTDGTWIDCTPDHKFLHYSRGNARSAPYEKAVDAINLKPKMGVRAFREYEHIGGYTKIHCAKWQGYKHRLVMENHLGRLLADGEVVHHVDENTKNDSINNLQLFESHAEHIRQTHNAHDYWTDESRGKISKALKAYRAKPEVRIARRKANLGKKNPNYKHGRRAGVRSRIEYFNHTVESVTAIDGLHDVYCLTVPETGWFFANNILIRNCSFCCINAPFGASGIRFWSPENVLYRFSYLANLGVIHVKIPDEMFVLKPGHVEAICDGLIKMPHRFNIWAYARVDTVKDDRLLAKMKRAGFNWLGVGVESASKHVRDGVDKGRFGNADIISAIRRVQSHGINVGANYIFGLPDDNHFSMQATLDLACELNTEWANFYCAMGYPGSALHGDAVKRGWFLPEQGPGWLGYSQHAKETIPLRTEHISSAEVLEFRDKAFQHYFTRPEYLALIRSKFGADAEAQVRAMTEVKLERSLLQLQGGFDAIQR